MEVDEGVDLSVIKAGKQHPRPRPYSHTKICSDHPSFFVPNIGHFLFRPSVIFHFEHQVFSRPEHRSFFVPDIR